MSVTTTVARPTGRTVGAAVLGVLGTLVVFLVAVAAFVLAPVLLLGVAYLAHLVLRPRSARGPAGGRRAPRPGDPVGVPAHSFGSGA